MPGIELQRVNCSGVVAKVEPLTAGIDRGDEKGGLVDLEGFEIYRIAYMRGMDRS